MFFNKSDIKYFVNENNKTVTAVLENTKYLFARYADNHCPMLMGSFVWEYPKYMFMPNKFTATAKCSDEDVFDEHVGKIVARAKLERKIYRSFDKRLAAFRLNIFDDMSTFFNKYESDVEKFIYERDNTIKYLEGKLKKNG